MSASDYLNQRTIDFVLNSNAEFNFTSPANVYAALFTVAPNGAGGGTECTGVNYIRVNPGAFSPMTGVTDGHSSNLVKITFPKAGAGGWGSIVSLVLLDAITGGNMIYVGTPTLIKNIGENDTYEIEIGDFHITLSSVEE